MQVLQRNHTTNPIEAKIELQITLIAMYLSDSFFVVRLAFKGQIQTFSRNISWLTCLNLWAIESRTQENHEELKIFLQKCLISSRFNQKLHFKKREHRFIEKSSQKIWAIRFAEEQLDAHDAATSHAISGPDPMTQAPLLLDFCRLIFIRVSTWSCVSLHDSPSAMSDRNHRISFMRSTVAH